MAQVYAIKFDYPEGNTLYAGMFKDALGWAPTLATALFFPSREAAGRTLANGYGPSAAFGTIVAVNTEEVT